MQTVERIQLIDIFDQIKLVTDQELEAGGYKDGTNCTILGRVLVQVPSKPPTNRWSRSRVSPRRSVAQRTSLAAC